MVAELSTGKILEKTLILFCFQKVFAEWIVFKNWDDIVKKKPGEPGSQVEITFGI